MQIFTKRNKFKGLNYLELTPVRLLEFDLYDGGLVLVMIPKFKKKFFKRLFLNNRPLDIRLKLDELGSAVWLELDGQKNVQDIIDELTLKFGNKIQPAEARITKFLTNLYQNKFITFNELNNEKDG